VSLEVHPPVGDAGVDAVREALVRARVPLERRPRAYDSPWRHEAAREAVENEREVEGYARSPRSTRGATSA
jgi:hypothetical protein